jgi:hypothetical protein
MKAPSRYRLDLLTLARMTESGGSMFRPLSGPVASSLVPVLCWAATVLIPGL